LAAHEAQAYQDPGTPEEQSRRQFLANVTIAVGGVIGLVIAVPVLTSLVPDSLIRKGSGKGQWTPLSSAEFSKLEASADSPLRLDISFKTTDAYLPPAPDEQFVWGIKLSPTQVANFQKNRPDLYANPAGRVDYPAITMNFVIFSSTCPHLGCRFNWSPENKRFICPCHGSQFSLVGEKLAGPAPRGLDPLPFRDADGKAEVTWIDYKTQQPSRVIIAYT
jgi:Rieske Fe-S protein